MSTTKSTSAFIGQPPNNEHDANIIRGWYRGFGLNNVNVSAGFAYAAKRPPNYVHESKQAAIIAGMVISILTIVVVTGCRLAFRLKGSQTKFGVDDWAIIIAASLAVVYPCLQLDTVINAGAGKHIWEGTYEGYNLYAYNLGLCQLIFYITVGFIKVSIALFVRRLADRASKGWRIFCDFFLVTLAIYILLALFWWVFLCSPPRARWDRAYSGSLAEPAKCGPGSMQIKALSIIHVTQGIILLFAPIIILWHIRIDMAKKVRLFVIWAVGGLTITGGLLQQTSVVITNDAFWQYTSILRWTMLDLVLGIVVASLPVLDGAIMGVFYVAKTTITSNSNNRSHTQQWTNLEASTNTTTNCRGPKEYSESVEKIIKSDKDNGIEMTFCVQTKSPRVTQPAAVMIPQPKLARRAEYTIGVCRAMDTEQGLWLLLNL